MYWATPVGSYHGCPFHGRFFFFFLVFWPFIANDAALYGNLRALIMEISVRFVPSKAQKKKNSGNYCVYAKLNLSVDQFIN